MRRWICLLSFLILVLFLPGCGSAPKAAADAASITSFRDIPGVTEEEIAEIDKLRSARGSFSFGQMEETEAFILPDGTYAGFTAEFCALLSRLFEIDFTLKLYDWDTLKSGIDEQRIDFTGDLTPTPERMQVYSMTHPIAERTLRIFVHEDNHSIVTEKDVNGLYIGSLAGTVDTDQVKRYYPELTFHTVEVESFDAAALMLKSGEIDAFISEGVIDPFFDAYGYVHSKEFFPLVYTSVSLTTADPGLKPIIEVFNKYLTAGGIDVLFDYYRECNKEYARNKLNKSLTAEEKAYIQGVIARGGAIKVALEQDNYPVCFYDKEDKDFQGIAVDVLERVGELIGIGFEVANDEKTPWSEILEMLRSGEASMVSQLLYSEERKGNFLWTESPYASAYYALLSQTKYPSIASYQVVRAKVGAIRKSAFADKYNEWFPENDNLVYFDDQIDVLDALESGDIDLLMGSDYLLLMQQNYREKPGFKINIRFGSPMYSYFGFNVDETLLCSIVDKAQAFVDLATISNDWTSRGYDYAKNLAHQRSLYFGAIAIVLSLALILTGYFLIRNRKLNAGLDQKVKEITLDIQATVGDLQKAQETVSAMFSANPQINILFDGEFRVVDCNPAAVEFMGFENKEEMLEGFVTRMVRSIPEYQSDGRASISMQERLVAAARDGYTKFDTELNIINETRILSVELIRIPYGDSFALVGYIFDMTEMHERENELIRRDEQLSEAVEEARAANRAKSDFLSNMSHEIRTPLNAILGITEIQLLNESLDPQVKEGLGKIYSSGDLLLGIINDILDLSKIEAGKMELIIARYEIASLLSDTAQLNMMRIGSKPIAFDLDVDDNTPTVLIGDELRVKQILNNLLSNAFKYTAEGTVNLSVSAEAGQGEGETEGAILVFRVSDTGQGMSKEQVDRLFDQYSRFNQQANRTTEGTGLGMSITQNLIRMMNGEILVDSEPGKGSVFTIRLPQGDGGAGPLGKEMTDNLHQFRQSSRAQMKRVQITREPMPYGSVLIVDDVETNIFVATGLMTPYGLKVDSAGSGFEAVEMINNGNVYDIVFMDHMMPKMDGMEATKIIRGGGYDQPIVALTANAVIGQSDLFLSNGFDDFISKPIDIRQLNTVLNKFIRDKQTPEVIEEARRQAEAKHSMALEEPDQPAIDPRFAEVFVRDAKRALGILEELMARQGAYSEEDVRAYVINVHGMKSALANIGEAELSAVALKLEAAGREGNTTAMTTETPAFLDALRVVTERLAPHDEGGGGEAADADLPYLRETLLKIKEACGSFDKKTARNLIGELRDKPWPQPIGEFLSDIAEHLLHSDFDELTAATERFLETL
ncbi:MAG: transporter substrate-binding domain-containing protein [Clostridiales bacterium]|nr:transporter substrate-binding domain-containing protein [Clostridiales bacterium]